MRWVALFLLSLAACDARQGSFVDDTPPPGEETLDDTTSKSDGTSPDRDDAPGDTLVGGDTSPVDTPTIDVPVDRRVDDVRGDTPAIPDRGLDGGNDVAADRVDATADVSAEPDAIDAALDVVFTSCAACSAGRCSSVQARCDASVFCSGRFDCYTRCDGAGGDRRTCYASCLRAWPDALADELAACRRVNCAALCSTDGGGGECAPGATRSCFTGPAATRGVGPCRAGTQVCDGAGGWPTACAGETTPTSEGCDGVDNDCDGTVDGPGASGSCVLARASGTCRAGACAITSCEAPYLDCDRVAANGCEVDPRVTTAHCGACGMACPAGRVCAAGRCEDRPQQTISLGWYQSCAVTGAGEVHCWGAVRGNGPAPEPSWTRPSRIAGISEVVAVAAGGSHLCALRVAGTLLCWGSNTYSQLGDGTTMSRTTPVAVPGVEGVAEVIAFSRGSCARTGAGRILCWGEGSGGALGHGYSREIMEVIGMGTYSRMDAQAAHTCMVRPTGTVDCTGSNIDGQLGDGTARGPVTGPLTVYDITDAVDVGAGGSSTCAVRRGGTVMCWGSNSHGQLGLGTVGGGEYRPRAVTGLTGVVRVRVGAAFACALLGSGAVWCWGSNTFSQLGDGTSVPRGTPAPVMGIDDAVELDLGYGHACVRRRSGAVWCWGDNLYGALGDGTFTTRSRPVAVVGLP
jgi:alpha-tubulin suppressor-like RCC1 family protein